MDSAVRVKREFCSYFLYKKTGAYRVGTNQRRVIVGEVVILSLGTDRLHEIIPEITRDDIVTELREVETVRREEVQIHFAVALNRSFFSL